MFQFISPDIRSRQSFYKNSIYQNGYKWKLLKINGQAKNLATSFTIILYLFGFKFRYFFSLLSDVIRSRHYYTYIECIIKLLQFMWKLRNTFIVFNRQHYIPAFRCQSRVFLCTYEKIACRMWHEISKPLGDLIYFSSRKSASIGTSICRFNNSKSIQ